MPSRLKAKRHTTRRMTNDENVAPNGSSRMSCKYHLRSIKEKVEDSYEALVIVKSVRQPLAERLPFVAADLYSPCNTMPTLSQHDYANRLSIVLSTPPYATLSNISHFEKDHDDDLDYFSLHDLSLTPDDIGPASAASAKSDLEKRGRKLLKTHRFHHFYVRVMGDDAKLERWIDRKSDDANIYEVEKVLAIRKINGGKNEYLLKWKNYDYNMSSWEKSAEGCVELLNDYKTRERFLRHVLQTLKRSDYISCYNHYYFQNFYHNHKWEDKLTALAAAVGQGSIYVANWIEPNIHHLGMNFTFITTNKISDDVMRQFKTSTDLTFCHCDSDHCGSSKNCCPDIYGMKYAYTSLGRVRQKFDAIGEWLIECADGCTCGPDCPTRVVQRGRQIPVVIFRTMDRGWSVRTLINIKANTFVMEYIGEVVTVERAQQSRLATYQFDMDACHECAFVVDALHYGNEARFVNHSCDPNMVVRGVFSDRYDMRYHRIAYFARHDIRKGEELTINYFAKHSDDEFERLTRKKSNKSCFCRAANCRGFFI